ncbi:MAG TPA: hypothetical protein VES69_00400 [Pyrinomonadaceae bacterium]|nr:hypothetical protein [Pyrinomonadaceae bacterium]
MKRITLWISVALVALLVGIAFLSWRLFDVGSNAPLSGGPIYSESEITESSLCQLVAKPEEYEGKMVRVRVVYMFGIHGPTIADRSCEPTSDTITWVSLTPAMWDEVGRATESAYGNEMSGPLDMVAIGKFGRNNPLGLSDLWKDRAPFKFELMTIEKAVRSSGVARSAEQSLAADGAIACFSGNLVPSA